jgi:hypothetical protein
MWTNIALTVMQELHPGRCSASILSHYRAVREWCLLGVVSPFSSSRRYFLTKIGHVSMWIGGCRYIPAWSG